MIDIQNGKLVQQYKNPKCQALLLKVLISLFEQPFLKIPPPLQLAINILNTAKITGKNEIPFICQLGLNTLEKLSQPICKSLYIQRHYDHQTPKEQSQEKEYFVPKFEQTKVKSENKKIRILSNIKLNDYIAKPPETEKVTSNVLEEESMEYEVESVKSSEDFGEPVLTSVEIVEIEEEFEFVAKTESRISSAANEDNKKDDEDLIFLLEDEEETIIIENGNKKDNSESLTSEDDEETIIPENGNKKESSERLTSEDNNTKEGTGKNFTKGKSRDGSDEYEMSENTENLGETGENEDSENVEPPCKKTKEAENIDDEDDMINSFVDVVNE